jgi:hypothetical protein
VRRARWLARRWNARRDLLFGEADALPAPEPRITLPPLFVGGTGRSGTTIVAKILGAHPSYHMVPFELRFITDPGGLCDLVERRTPFDAFAWRVQHRWPVTGPAAGKRQLVSETWQRAALRELGAGLKRDRAGAAARFVHRMLDGTAAQAGASGWIEMTPGNVHVAPVLARIWPAARLVHAVRDGRDVACSVTPLTWGPDTLDEALTWWAESLADAFEACAAAPDGFVHTVRMESLLGSDRDAQLASVLAFAGLDEGSAVRAFFDERATTGRANIGRWRTDVPAGEVPGFLALHDRLSGGLIARGYPYQPFEAAEERQGSAGATVAGETGAAAR